MNNGTVIIDIREIFKTLYGYLPASVPPLPASPDQSNPYSVYKAPAKKTTTAAGSPLYGLADMIGREVFMPITITANGINYDFPFCIMGIRNKKIMKETPMTERGGVVIEEIATGAWEFDIKGFLIDANDQFPDDQLTLLNTLYTNNNPVYLRCAISDLFLPGGDQVVITEVEIPPKAKVIGVRDFAIRMIQDSILDLYKVA